MSANHRFSRILVTDAHKLAGLGAVRSLSRAGYSVVAGYPQGQQRPAGAWSRYWREEVRYPDPRFCRPEFRRWLRDQAEKGLFDAVLPVSEASVAEVSAARKISPCGFLPILPDEASLKYTLSKFHATRLALSLGVTCPRTAFVSSGDPAEKWNRDLSELRFPIVIKIDNYLTAEGAFRRGRNFVVTNANEADETLKELNRTRTGIIAQEIIPGHGTGAFLLRYNGKVLMTFAHRRLHEVPYTGGASSFRESIEDEELVNLSTKLLDAIDYNGLAMVEFRRSRLDGAPYFLEINGRLWGSVALALHSGADFPRALIECYENGAPTAVQAHYRPGTRCRNIFPGEISHLVSILKAKPNKSAETAPSKTKAVTKFIGLSLNPMIRHDYFWWRDPLPGFVQMARSLRWVGAKMFDKFQNQWQARELKRLRLEHQLRYKQPKYFGLLPKKVLFLCYGNICRSPFAEHLWNARMREGGRIAVSAGFHPRSDRSCPGWAIELAAEHGLDLDRHRSRIVTRGMVESTDAIFVMDHRNYRDLLHQFPWAKPKTYLLGLFAEKDWIEIDDPFSMNHEDARVCYARLAQSLNGLMDIVRQEETPTERVNPRQWKAQNERYFGART
jgi:predicted ATP-grasp superfamily ATP-dependent carboligase/protein-tyrosine-phosphatase